MDAQGAKIFVLIFLSVLKLFFGLLPMALSKLIEVLIFSFIHFEIIYFVFVCLERKIGLAQQIDVWSGLLWWWCTNSYHFSSHAARFSNLCTDKYLLKNTYH